jgi:FkbM family methyltransferase
LRLDLRDHAQYIVYSEGAYEPRLAERIREELRRDDVFVDIGANIGVHALSVALELQRLGGGHVYAFEPAPDSADRLASAVERNSLRNVTLVRAAVGDSVGHLDLRDDPAFTARDLGVRSAFGQGRVVCRVPLLRFDEWATRTQLGRLDLVKIDVEGGELAAIIGMRDTLARLRPRLVLVEVNPVTLARAGVTKEQLYAALAASRYEPEQEIRDHETVENAAFRRQACLAPRIR